MFMKGIDYSAWPIVSHTLARCAAALTRNAIGIGIDVEHRISTARADCVRSGIADRSETSYL